ncbi:MAG: DNA primase [Alphaproteobacteria bacterium]
MSFSPQFLDEIRARLPLSDTVGKRVRLARRGREFMGLCPFHNEKTPSFTVNDEKGFFHCFGCGAHGDVIGFVMRTDGMSFPEAIEKLAGEAGLQVPQSSPEDRARAKQVQSLHAINEAALAWFEKNLRSMNGRAAMDYLRNRGLSDETIARFRLGFSLNAREALKSHLTGQGIPEALLLEAGLLARPEDQRAPYDRFRGRVMFPIADARGRIIAFGGRAMGDDTPKYLNTAETPIFHKGRNLYALPLAREAVTRGGQELIVVEGYMDVIALHQAGFTGAVAPLGTALTEQQIELLWRLAPEPILCFDGDEAGSRAAARAAERVLPLLKAGHSLRFLSLPKGEDPDSLIQRRGKQAFVEVLARARPLVDLLWHLETDGKRQDTPERRAAVSKALRDHAANIADRSVQELYLADFGARLGQLFGTAKRPQGRGGPLAAKSGAWPRRQPKYGRRGFAEDAPDDPGLNSRGDTSVLLRRQEEALLATLLNHPDLLHEVAEALGHMVFGDTELDSIRQEILKTAALGLDSTEIQNHLRGLGFSDFLDRVMVRDLYELVPFAKPGADAANALVGWLHLHEVFHRRHMDPEIERARERLASDVSARNWAYLDALNRQKLPRPDPEAETATKDTKR